MHPIPDFSGWFINEEGTSIVGPGGKTPAFTEGGGGRLRVRIGKKRPYVHHLMALTFIGPRPTGQEVRHLDDSYLNNHRENIAYGTRIENVADSIEAGSHISVRHRAKTHCPQKHEYSVTNTYWYTKKNGVRGRQCITCLRTRTRQYHEQKRTSSSTS